MEGSTVGGLLAVIGVALRLHCHQLANDALHRRPFHVECLRDLARVHAIPELFRKIGVRFF